MYTTKRNTKGKEGLSVTITCHRRFTEGDKGPPLGRNAGECGGRACVQTAWVWAISVPCTPFCCEPKTALKNKTYF